MYAIPVQPVHEAAREGGHRLFLRVGLSIILVLFVYLPHSCSPSATQRSQAAPHENETFPSTRTLIFFLPMQHARLHWHLPGNPSSSWSMLSCYTLHVSLASVINVQER